MKIPLGTVLVLIAIAIYGLVAAVGALALLVQLKVITSVDSWTTLYVWLFIGAMLLPLASVIDRLLHRR